MPYDDWVYETVQSLSFYLETLTLAIPVTSTAGIFIIPKHLQRRARQAMRAVFFPVAGAPVPPWR